MRPRKAPGAGRELFVTNPGHRAAREGWPARSPAQRVQRRSYAEILTSSMLVGGASAITIVLGIVRTKALALMLGPAGIGMIGLYLSIADLTRSVASLGIGGSAVRQVAGAAASGDVERIGRTLAALRVVSIVLALAGGLFLFGLRDEVSRLTFGSTAHAQGVALLGLAVFCHLLAERYTAVIQGMRRVAELARMAVLNGLIGMLASIAIIYFLREDGVVLSLVALAVIALGTGWWYSRRTGVRPAAISRSQVVREAAPLLKLGLAFMASGLLMAGAAYAVRAMVLRQAGMEAAGLYQAAWTLGGLYISFILNAMGVDFYPRLVGVANDERECNRLVNEQAEVSLTLAAPGVVATLVLAPLVVRWFYSPSFAQAAELLRWICLGMALRVVSWPMGFIIVAKAQQTWFFLTEVAWTAVNVGLAWLCLRRFGLVGVGTAFFLSYVFHAFMIYAVVRGLTGFRWSRTNIGRGGFLLSVIAAAFLSQLFLPSAPALAVGVVAIGITAASSVLALASWAPDRWMNQPVRRILLRLRLLPGGGN
jgi:antigen flippase